MTTLGFHASHEQAHPAALLEAVRRAEEVGFEAAMCSDHFAPWSARQGHSGFAWSWLGAALATTSLPFGVVTAPGQRYHPAIIAQASATLAAMFPGRFWVALGSGEAVNEHITGDRWPPKPERQARLLESVEVIRALHAGEEVTHRGLVQVDRARVWSLPDDPPALVGAAVSPETAAWCARWADGLITVNQPMDALRRVVEGYREAGGRGPATLQVHVSYAANEGDAWALAHDQWRNGAIGAPACWDTDSVEAFDAMGEVVRPEDLRDAVLVSDDPAQHAAWLVERRELGFDAVQVHHVGKDQTEFLDVFGAKVLPQVRAAA
ncbi:MAG: TIGR03885 family FMN-dependent LLM class oxidoreductase [Acidimicrobiales bacterium]